MSGASFGTIYPWEHINGFSGGISELTVRRNISILSELKRAFGAKQLKSPENPAAVIIKCRSSCVKLQLHPNPISFKALSSPPLVQGRQWCRNGTVSCVSFDSIRIENHKTLLSIIFLKYLHGSNGSIFKPPEGFHRELGTNYDYTSI